MNREFTYAMILILAAGLICSGPAAAKTYKIGVMIAHASPGLQADQRGFAKALEEAGIQAEYDHQNAQGDAAGAEAIAQKFLTDEVDLVHAVGLEAAQAAAKIIKDVPVVYSSVRDPVGAGVVKTLAADGGNITGVSNAWPIDQQVDLFHRMLPAAKKWGTVYNAGDPFTAKAVERARELMGQLGLELIEARVSGYNDIPDAAKSLAGKVDAVFMTPDPMVAKEFGAISGMCNENKIPLFSGNPNLVVRGAVAAMGTDFVQVGVSAGHKAVQILKEGQKPGEIPSGVAEHLILYISLKNAKKQGVEVQEEFIKQADRVFK
ncbi:MAG: ABC transporter substrate-binding protein [Desulfobacterales bacterium]|nr:MAG: ABC transporter substrate-binding protein [Desulfobacterales bacterium]